MVGGEFETVTWAIPFQQKTTKSAHFNILTQDTTEQLQESTLRELPYKIELRHFEKKSQIIKISSKTPNSTLNGVLWAKNGTL